MANIDELFQSVVNLEYDELMARAQDSFGTLYGAYKEAFNEEQAIELLLISVFTCVCADGTLTGKEEKFINDLAGTNYSHSEIMSMVRDYGNDEAYDTADKIFDNLPDGGKAELLDLCLCVCAIDERISKDEVAFILQMLR